MLRKLKDELLLFLLREKSLSVALLGAEEPVNLHSLRVKDDTLNLVLLINHYQPFPVESTVSNGWSWECSALLYCASLTNTLLSEIIFFLSLHGFLLPGTCGFVTSHRGSYCSWWNTMFLWSRPAQASEKQPSAWEGSFSPTSGFSFHLILFWKPQSLVYF